MSDKPVPAVPTFGAEASVQEIIQVALRTYIESQNPFYASAMEPYLGPVSNYIEEALSVHGKLLP